jgi:hypothetical protein
MRVATAGRCDALVVCLPSVAQRTATLAETLAQWRGLGYEPLVETQPGDWPAGGWSQRRTSERVLRRALDARPDATHLLFTEDDVDLAPELALWLPALINVGAPVTLYASGVRHYPRSVVERLHAGAPLPEGIVPVRALADWYGTLGVVLPREVVEEVLCWESGQPGWDTQLQHFLRATGQTLYMTVPNLVQHRGVPTVASPVGGIGRSATFGAAHDGAGWSPVDVDGLRYGVSWATRTARTTRRWS